MTDTFKHWDKIYKSQKTTQVSWHQEHSTISLKWLLQIADKNDAIIDIGSGVSVLADNLLEAGFVHLSLLEISTTAMQISKDRLKNKPNQPIFYNENILDFATKQRFDVWHDRAVFHFLTNKKDQQTYRQKLNQYLKIGGYFLLATFSPQGPKFCSKLKVVQYNLDKIMQLLGENFQLIKTASEQHPHPNGEMQNFNYFLFMKSM